MLERLRSLPSAEALMQWAMPLKVWSHYNMAALSPDHKVRVQEDGGEPRPITFRVTCTRRGRQHSFSSMEAAGSLGHGLAERFGWKVQMKNADVNVLLWVTGDDMEVGVALNRESRFKRNITHFGPTSLRPTIAYSMIRSEFTSK